MGTILAPIGWIEIVVSKILLAFHWLLTHAGLSTDGGATWALSIVGLVVVIRTLLIPVFVRQIRAQRGLQLLQPEIKKIQEKHKNDKQKQSAELMELYKREGTNPLASCLPILLQSPIFFALFRVLNNISHGKTPPGFDRTLVAPAQHASLFGAQISDTFTHSSGAPKLVALTLIILMCATTFLTQRQVMTQNMPKESLSGNAFAQQQKTLLYVFPLIFAVTGINFPIGVLIYWLTTNLWSMAQQFYVIRNNPTPNTPAYEAWQSRKDRRTSGKANAAVTLAKTQDAAAGRTSPAGSGEPSPHAGGTSRPPGSTAPGGPQRGQRTQPKRQPRSKR